MEPSRAAETRLTPDAAEFVRFCYRRRAVGWPELYDEMCAVASRGLFRGWGPTELAEQGVGFGLFDLPALAELTRRILAEEQMARSSTAGPKRVAVRLVAEPSLAPATPASSPEASPAEARPAGPRLVSLAS